jgi:hypothetical protein
MMMIVLLLVGQSITADGFAFANSTSEDENSKERSVSYIVALNFGVGYWGIVDAKSIYFLGSNAYAYNLGNSIYSFDHIDKERFERIRLRPPISLGMKMHIPIKERTVIESALIYTHLTSSFRFNQWYDFSVEQQLHYIGIPLNIKTLLGNNVESKFQVYFSTGVMVEKALRAIYKQKEMPTNQTHTRNTTVKSSIEGLHWSIFAAFGLSYRFLNSFEIQVEPRIGHYFRSKKYECNNGFYYKNVQPISTRTENPSYFGINLGLNYKL